MHNARGLEGSTQIDQFYWSMGTPLNIGKKSWKHYETWIRSHAHMTGFTLQIFSHQPAQFDVPVMLGS